MLGRDDWRVVSRFALGFAALATAVWAALVLPDSESGAADSAFYAYVVVNFGGYLLAFAIQWFVGAPIAMLLGLDDPAIASVPGIDLLSWAWILGTVFVGAFAQGFVYGALGLLGFRWCRARRLGVAPGL